MTTEQRLLHMLQESILRSTVKKKECLGCEMPDFDFYNDEEDEYIRTGYCSRCQKTLF